MTNITELVQFKAGEKAASADVNQNFETLRTSNNEHQTNITVYGLDPSQEHLD